MVLIGHTGTHGQCPFMQKTVFVGHQLELGLVFHPRQCSYLEVLLRCNE